MITFKKIDTKFWDEPRELNYDEFPVYTTKDYEDRIEKFWNHPDTADFSTVVIYADREHFSNIHYFTGYDVRWEESILVLNRNGKRLLIVGSEGIDYVQKVTLDLDVELYRSFSLQGQPADNSQSLSEMMKDYILIGDLGLIGFKTYDNTNLNSLDIITDVPYYIVEEIKKIAKGNVKNITYVMNDNEKGLKHDLTAKEIVEFEFNGTKISRGVYNCLKNLKEGMNEIEASRFLQFDGSPRNMHPNINFGEAHTKLAVNSPVYQSSLKKGQMICVGYGLRGSLVHKAGLFIQNISELPENISNYYEDFAFPYFESILRWYDLVRIGNVYGDIYNTIDTELGLAENGVTLNPGHFINTDEWTNTPFQAGSTVKVESGVAIQCDYTVTRKNPYMTTHVEDGLIIADEELQAEVKEIAPDTFARMSERKKVISEMINFEFPDETLLLSDLNGILNPFMADVSTIYAVK